MHEWFIFKNKYGSIFSHKKALTGGSEGGLAIDQTFYGFFLRNPSLMYLLFDLFWVRHSVLLTGCEPDMPARDVIRFAFICSIYTAHCEEASKHICLGLISFCFFQNSLRLRGAVKS